MDKSSNTERVPERPDPDDLYNFLPWACGQMQLPKYVFMAKNLQSEYVSTVVSERGKSTKGLKSRPRLPSVPDVPDNKREGVSASFGQDNDVVRVNTVHDYADNVVGLKFDRNYSIPRMLMQILGLVIKYQIYLTSLTINQGLNKYALYEIVKFLPDSKITDLCLDNCFLSEGTYYTVLEQNTNLKNLSLARCRINDDVVALIFDRLCYPKIGSTTLVILNLSSNRITDVGAKSIRAALKTNSKLAYLNLADNLLTDEGAATILNVLMEFPITKVELTETRIRHIQYLRDRNKRAREILVELRSSDRGKKPIITAPKGKGKDLHAITVTEVKSTVLGDVYLYERAQALAEHSIKPFKDPFCSDNVTTRDGVTYCLGNNSLLLLNLSYNSLTWVTLQKLLEVLIYQRELDRKPRGLFNCRIEGNPMPVGCKELNQIEEILESGLSGPKRNQGLGRKKVK